MAECKITKRQLAAALRAAGLTDEQKSRVRVSLGGDQEEGPAISHGASARIRSTCVRQGDVAVVVLGRKSHRVFTLTGYKQLQKNGKNRISKLHAEYKGGKKVSRAKQEQAPEAVA